jgi:hypothetical protein
VLAVAVETNERTGNEARGQVDKGSLDLRRLTHLSDQAVPIVNS